MAFKDLVAGAGIALAAARAVNEVAAAVRDSDSAGHWLGRLNQRLRGKRPGVPRLQLVYWEVLYNAFSLRAFQKLRPPSLLVSTTEWTRDGTAEVISRHLTAAELARVSAAYGQIEPYRWFFGQGYLSLFADRVGGEDQKAMETLAGWFVEAEKALRRAAFSSRDYPRVTHAVEVELDIARPAERKPLLERTHGALIGGRDIEQVGFVTVMGFAVVLAIYRLWAFGGWLNRRFKHSER